MRETMTELCGGEGEAGRKDPPPQPNRKFDTVDE